MTYLIVGGSSGVGRALAERFAAAGHALVIVSSDRRDTQALANDLGLRWSVPVGVVTLDLAAANLAYEDLDAALAKLPPLHGILLPAGMNRPDDAPGQRDSDFEMITRTNYSSLCSIVNRYLPRLREAGKSCLVVGFGSVAAVRGRTRNAAYAAAKRALGSYFESLRHSLNTSGGIVQFYTLGYIDTNLAFGQVTPLPKASPARLADRVYHARCKNFGHAFYPAFWMPVCMLLRALPWFVFRRLSF